MKKTKVVPLRLPENLDELAALGYGITAMDTFGGR